MNTQSLDLNKMGLAPMQFNDMQEIDGGQLVQQAASTVGGVLQGVGAVVTGPNVGGAVQQTTGAAIIVVAALAILSLL